MIIASVNLEKALLINHPNDPLWDYGIGYRSTDKKEKVSWIEVHPASSTHIDELLKKFHWLKRWLRNSAPGISVLPCEFVWIASGSVHLQNGSPQMKRLAQVGLRFAGRSFVLDP